MKSQSKSSHCHAQPLVEPWPSTEIVLSAPFPKLNRVINLINAQRHLASDPHLPAFFVTSDLPCAHPSAQSIPLRDRCQSIRRSMIHSTL